MPVGGAGQIAPQILLYGKPWQRGCVVLALIVAGAMLLVFGSYVGVAPTVLGVVLGTRMWGPTCVRAV